MLSTKMKNWMFLLALLIVIFLVGCEASHNFMDVDNPNAKEDLKYYFWSGNIPKINTDNVIPDNLSWAWNDAKWYANKYYEDTLEGYVDVAKEGLSWAKESVKWYYNSWVDELNKMVSDKVNQAISWELNKFKIK